jgi:beta-phosphoglucomutase-like phosphatase (HAD superfamily)
MVRVTSGVSLDLIIFDCDGVLIDSEVLTCRTDAACLGEIGITISAKEIVERYVGISTPTMLPDIASRFGTRLPEDFPATLQRRIAEAFEAELTAIPGIEQTLFAIPARVCVASSSAPESLRHSLSIVGLLHHFEPNVFSAGQVARGKPAPDLFYSQHNRCVPSQVIAW